MNQEVSGDQFASKETDITARRIRARRRKLFGLEDEEPSTQIVYCY